MATDIVIPIFLEALFTKLQIQQQKSGNNPSVQGLGEWIRKTLTMVHIHNGILLDHLGKKNKQFSAMWMDLASIMLNEIRDWHRHGMISSISRIKRNIMVK